MSEKLLVVGTHTLVGANVALALADRFDVLELGGPPASQAVATAQDADCRIKLDAVKDAVQRHEPDWIVYCGPLAAGSWDLEQAAASVEHEPRLAGCLANEARQVGARLTIVLTDAVVGGPRFFHDESSPVAPRCAAGRAAVQIEQQLADSGALIVRTHAYGWSPHAAVPCLAERVCAALAQDRAIPLDGRRYATPILATDLADLLTRAYELDLQGLLHIVGAERTSPYRFACQLATAFGLPAPRSWQQAEVGDFGSHCETSLNSRRARRTLERPMPMLREGLERFAAQAENGWRERLTGNPLAGSANSRLSQAA